MKRYVTVLALQALGFLWLGRAVSRLLREGVALAGDSGFGFRTAAIIGAVSAALLLAVALLLLWRPRALTARLFPRESEETGDPAPAIRAVAVPLVGLYLLVTGAAAFADALMPVARSLREGHLLAEAIHLHRGQDVVESAALALFGLGLLLGPRVWAWAQRRRPFLPTYGRYGRSV